MGGFDLARAIDELGNAGPRLYARWSARAWAVVCAGPAVRLWDALKDEPEAATTLLDYLALLQEAVGLQVLSMSNAEELKSDGGTTSGRTFLAAALCDALPRLLPAAPARDRGRLMANVWNVGEKLAHEEVWLNRYLAARLPELDALERFEGFLGRVVSEGVDPAPPAKWRGDIRWSVHDVSTHDAVFLPGEMHLATPSIVCVHDRLRADRQIGLLQKRDRVTGLGAMPCLEAPHAPKPVEVALESFASSRVLPERYRVLAAPGGHVVVSSPLSQRLWVGVVDE